MMCTSSLASTPCRPYPDFGSVVPELLDKAFVQKCYYDNFLEYLQQLI